MTPSCKWPITGYSQTNCLFFLFTALNQYLKCNESSWNVFWQYLSLSTHDTNVILYEIKALVSDNLFSFFFTSLSKPQHLQIRKFNTASVRTSFLTAHPRRPRGSQSGRVKRPDGSFQPVLENFCRALSPGPSDRPWVSEDAYSQMRWAKNVLCPSRVLPICMLWLK